MVKFASKSSRPSKKRFNYIPYLFVAPNIILFLCFMIIPILYTTYISLTNWSVIGIPKFIGLNNYLYLLKDSTFWISLWNTAYYTFVTVPVIIVLALVFALILNRKIKFRGAFRAAIYLPAVISTIAAGILWMWIFNTDFGVLNYILNLLGLKSMDWLTNGNLAMIPVILTTIWSRVGYNMVIYLAALQDIPVSYYEASYIDGASKWQQFKSITLPLLKPTHIFVLVMAIIFSFKSFDLIYVMTRGGPGTATTTTVQYIYKTAFEVGKMGRASALGIILFAIMAILTAVQLKFGEKE